MCGYVIYIIMMIKADLIVKKREREREREREDVVIDLYEATRKKGRLNA